MSSIQSFSWLGDPDVSVMSEDGHVVMTHRSVLGLYSSSFRHVLSINPPDWGQCMIICQDLDANMVDEMVRNAKLNFQRFTYEDCHSEDVQEHQTKLISTVLSTNVNEENKGLTDSQSKQKKVMKLIGTMPKELHIEIVKMESEHSRESESSSTETVAISIVSDGVADAERKESSIQEGKSHNSKSVLKGNFTTHANKKHLGNPKTYLCDQCDFKAGNSGVLKRHQRGVHEGIKLQCNFCEYKASYEANIREHIRFVHEKIKIQCHQCGKQFKGEHSLRKHIQSFHGGRKYKCQFCEYHATWKPNLRVHFEKIHKDMDIEIYKERMKEFRYTRNQGTIIGIQHD